MQSDEPRTKVKVLAKAAAFGTLSDWRLACEQARLDGWSHGQVQLVLLWAHPLTWIAVAAIVAVGWEFVHGR